MAGLRRHQQRPAVARIEHEVIDDVPEKMWPVGPPLLPSHATPIDRRTLARADQEDDAGARPPAGTLSGGLTDSRYNRLPARRILHSSRDDCAVALIGSPQQAPRVLLTEETASHVVIDRRARPVQQDVRHSAGILRDQRQGAGAAGISLAVRSP